LEVKNLKKYFDVTKGMFGQTKIVKAVDNVSLTVKRGETHGLVGESGCGKSTLGRTIVHIYTPTDGSIIFKGEDIAKIKNRELLKFKKNMQMIFQDPYASLNPRLTVGEIIKEPMDIHHIGDKASREKKVYELLNTVGLKPDHIRRYPHEFSGGQRQRVGIARTLALDPEFIICDEPISALDVSIQAQIINLLEKLRDERGISYLFIAHDISMVKHISQRISVMYLGHIVETGESNAIYRNPLHPYSKALLSAVCIPDPEIAKHKFRVTLKGEIPSPINPKPGCPFTSRCQYVMDVCKQEMPELKEVENHLVACHLFN
jgi:oligopeptide transport system ATP-binding protein